MTLISKMTGGITLSAIAVLVMGAFMAATVSAQFPLPMIVTGGGLDDGDVVEVIVDGVVLGETEVGAVEGFPGEWVFEILADDYEVGSVITFTVNGEAAAESVEVTETGQVIEVTLTPADDVDEPAAPDPADTGNAGLMGSAGTSMALVLALGVFAAALVAGGRTAVRRS
jgi:hypothetical protein